MDVLRAVARAVLGTLAALLPARWWPSVDARLDPARHTTASGVVTILLAAAMGVPGFLAHAGANASRANTAMLEVAVAQAGGGTHGEPEVTTAFAQGLTALSLFTFLLFTPRGLLTLYLAASGTLRVAAAIADDPMGDPLLTAADVAVHLRRNRRQTQRRAAERLALEGTEVPDRVVTGAQAGLDADLVVVSSRVKEGWTENTVLFSGARAFRIGAPVERMIAGRLRTLYPLREHRDLEAARRSVHYELP